MNIEFDPKLATDTYRHSPYSITTSARHIPAKILRDLEAKESSSTVEFMTAAKKSDALDAVEHMLSELMGKTLAALRELAKSALEDKEVSPDTFRQIQEAKNTLREYKAAHALETLKILEVPIKKAVASITDKMDEIDRQLAADGIQPYGPGYGGGVTH